MSGGFVDSKVAAVGLLLELLARPDGRPMALHSLLIRHGMTDLQGHVSWQGPADWIPRQQGKANGHFLLLGSASLQPQPRRNKGDHQARANLQPERMVGGETTSPTGYPMANGVEVVGLAELAGQLKQAG